MDTVQKTEADKEQELTDKILAIVEQRIRSRNYTTWKTVETLMHETGNAMLRGKAYHDKRHAQIEEKLSEITKALLISETFSIRISQLNRTIEEQSRQIEGLKIQVSELKRDKTTSN